MTAKISKCFQTSKFCQIKMFGNIKNLPQKALLCGHGKSFLAFLLVDILIFCNFAARSLKWQQTLRED